MISDASTGLDAARPLNPASDARGSSNTSVCIPAAVRVSPVSVPSYCTHCPSVGYPSQINALSIGRKSEHIAWYTLVEVFPKSCPLHAQRIPPSDALLRPIWSVVASRSRSWGPVLILTPIRNASVSASTSSPIWSYERPSRRRPCSMLWFIPSACAAVSSL